MGVMITKYSLVEKTLDETDKQILMLIAEGKTVKEIAWKTGKRSSNIEYRLRTMRKHYNCLNTTQLIAKLSEIT